jgi:thiamine-phosphate pyrophosphorylase
LDGEGGARGGASLPRLVLIADRFTAVERAAQVVAAVEAGVRWVQLRDHAAGEPAFARAAQALAARLRDVVPDVWISINSRLEVAQALGAGMHVGFRGPSVAEARAALKAEVLIGCSVHNPKEAARAVAAGADYLFVSPIFPTRSKPGHPGMGLTALRTIGAAFPVVPIFALGGLSPAHAAACREAGAYGAAVLSGIMEADASAEAARRYLQVLTQAHGAP